MPISFSNSQIDEKELIEGLRSGGIGRRRYENTFFQQYLYLVKQYQHKYSLPEDEVLSAYSDSIIVVIQNVLDGVFEGRSSLKSYTSQIFMNKCVDTIRRKTTNKNSVNRTGDIEGLMSVLPDQSRSVIQSLIDKGERNYLMENLKQLLGKCRELLLLYEDGYTDKEIAERMDYKSPEVAKTSRIRCLEKLKEKMIPTRSKYE